MSDRPDGSVRTGSRSEDTPTGGAPSDDATGAVTAAAGPSAPVQPATDTGTQAIPGAGAKADTSTAPPATGTQAIPTTGSQRATAAPVSAPAAAPQVPVPPVPVPAAATAPSGAGASATGATSGAAATAAKSRPGRTAGRGPRRARLQLRHIDTWSALKISLVLSIALFFIWMVAVGVLYGVLNALGVFDTLNELFGQLGTESGTEEGSDVLTPGVVFGGAAIIGAINIVLLTALCTVGTFIYNMCSDLVGGLELTLSERD